MLSETLNIQFLSRVHAQRFQLGSVWGLMWTNGCLCPRQDDAVNVSLCHSSRRWRPAAPLTLTQTAPESSLTSAESPSDGLKWDNYKFYPEFAACLTPYLVNLQTACDCASHP